MPPFDTIMAIIALSAAAVAIYLVYAVLRLRRLRAISEDRLAGLTQEEIDAILGVAEELRERRRAAEPEDESTAT